MAAIVMSPKTISSLMTFLQQICNYLNFLVIQVSGNI